MKIIFNIPNNKVKKVADALAGLYPIPEKPKSVNSDVFVPAFTKEEWIKECIRRWVIDQVKTWEEKEIKKQQVVKDDKIIQ